MRATHAILLGDARLIELVQQYELTGRFASTVVASLDDLPRLFEEMSAFERVVIALREYCDVARLTQLDEQCAAAPAR